MPYDVLRILSGFSMIIIGLTVLGLTLVGAIEPVHALFALLALVAISWCVGFVAGIEHPAETHEFCNPESCIHRRGAHRKVHS